MVTPWTCGRKPEPEGSAAGNYMRGRPDELLRPAQARDLEQEAPPCQLRTEAAHQLPGRARGASGGEDVIHDQDPGWGRQPVPVRLQCVRAVLQLVGLGHPVPGQLARLPG